MTLGIRSITEGFLEAMMSELGLEVYPGGEDSVDQDLEVRGGRHGWKWGSSRG